MDLNLRGRRALITGSSKGIGLAIARSLAAEGCHVQLVARTRADLERAAARIKSEFGVEATVHAADLSAGANVKVVAAAARDVDILVNSAGAIPRGTVLEIDEERWRKAWDLKLFGAINLTREIYRGMCEREHGAIINIAGMAGERPDAYYIAGSVANAALIMFSRSLGGDSIRHGVRVLVVNPGPVETDALIAHSSKLAKERLGDPSRWREIMHRVPMKRAATVEEVASMVAFLASDRCSYVSGSSILIDGGLLTDSSIGVNRA
jgi:NAD(P)-dependent dehydrogenase (short-subunit alcohol dehydrogenase family)